MSRRHALLGWVLAIGMLFGFTLHLGGGMAMTSTVRADAPSRVLRHVVLYRFKAELPAEAIQEVVDAFVALPKKIDTIVGFEHGLNVSQEGKSDGLTHAFVVSFADEAGRDAYLIHPAHLAYVEIVRDRRDKVVVFDYWTRN